MAAADRFWVNITGRGGHAAMPHLSIDPVIAASQVSSNALLAQGSAIIPVVPPGQTGIAALSAGACLQVVVGGWLVICW